MYAVQDTLKTFILEPSSRLLNLKKKLIINNRIQIFCEVQENKGCGKYNIISSIRQNTQNANKLKTGFCLRTIIEQ